MITQENDQSEYYKAIIDSTYDWEMLYSIEGQLVYISPSCLRISGYSNSEFIQKPALFFDIIYSSDKEIVNLDFSKISIKQIGKSIQFRIFTKTGDVKWVECYLNKCYSGSGMYLGVRSSIREITENKLNEQILREKEEFYHALFEKNKAIKLLIDPKTGKIEDANTAASEYYGYSLSELKKLRITDINQLTEIEVFAEMQKALDEKRQFFEFKHKLSSGEIRDVSVYSGPIKYKGKDYLYSIIYDITEQKIAERKIVESEEKYRNLYEKTPVMLHSIDHEGRLVSVSDYWLIKMGYCKQEVIGRKSLEFLTSKSQQLFFDHFPSFKEKGEIYNIPYQMIKKNGEIMDVLLSAISERNKDGSMKRSLAVIVDITEQKKAEEELKKSEEKFKLIINALPHFISYCSSDFKYLYVNEAYEKEFKLKKEKIINKQIKDVVGEQVFNQAYPHLSKVVKGESVRYYEYFTYKNGNKKHIDGQLIPSFDKNNNVIGYFGVLTDISPYMLASQALEKSEKEKSVVLESMSEMLTYCDKDLNIIWANKASLEHRKLTRKDIKNKKCFEAFQNKDSICPKCPVAKSLETKKPEEKEIINKDGRVFRLRAYPVINKSGEIEGVVEFAMDITEQRQKDEELRKMYNLYRTLTSNLPGINVFLFDDQKRIILAEGNEIREGVFKKSELENKSPFELSIDSKAKNYLSNFYQQALDGQKPSLQVQHENKWYHIFAVPIFSAKSKVIGGIAVAQNITEEKRIAQELEESRENIRNLSNHLQFLVEQEKSKFAREIHDEIGQNLTFIKLNLALLYNNYKSNLDTKRQVQFKNLFDVVDSSIKNVKKISSDLRPGLIDELGLIPAIEWHLSEFSNQTGIKCFFNYSNENKELSGNLSINIFRIIQESLTNVFKHAKANQVKIDFKFKSDFLEITIFDNGIGIKPADLKRKNSFGLTGMQERVELFKGEFKIKGKSGYGTTINIKIPLNFI